MLIVSIFKEKIGIKIADYPISVILLTFSSQLKQYDLEGGVKDMTEM